MIRILLHSLGHLNKNILNPCTLSWEPLPKRLQRLQTPFYSISIADTRICLCCLPSTSKSFKIIV